MKININNIGIIEDASLKLNGLTVITGYNNSGKTTVGKVIYSLFTSIEDLGAHILEDQKKYVINNLNQLWRDVYMEITNVNKGEVDNFFRVNVINRMNVIKKAEDIQHVNDLLSDFLSNLKEILCKLYSDRADEIFIENKYTEFKDAIENIQQIVNTSFLKDAYIDDKFEKTLKEEFVGQILPVNKEGIIGQITLEKSQKKVLDYKIQNNCIIDRYNSLDEVKIDKNVVFLDNVFLLDELSEKSREKNRWFFIDDEDTNISIKRHKEKLLDEIKEKDSNNSTIIDSILNKEKLDRIISKISKTFDDEIIIANDEIYSSNSKVYIENLAMGSKVFAILKLLLSKGIINEKTVLVLDEPEVHLHPEWQSILAEILALMIKELGVVVVLTTHSPQFLLALEYYMNMYKQKDMFNVYMTEDKITKSVTYREVTENIQEAYYRLSKPMFDIKNNIDKLKE